MSYTSFRNTALGRFKIQIFMSKIFLSIKNYILGSYAEMKKVSWPTKNQTINYSLIVLGLTLGMGLFFAALDYVFSIGINFLLTK